MELVRILKQICADRKLLVATAESVTVGHLQSMIAAVSGASAFFRGGITAYSIEQKVEVLGVERSHAERVDCVSSQVAAQMALGATRLFESDIGLATTGYAEPTNLPNSPVAYAYYAIWDKRESLGNPVRSGKLTSNNVDRVKNQCLFAELVLRELVAYLAFREGLHAMVQNVLRIERLSNGQYCLGQLVVDDISNVDEAVKAVKRSVPITAVQVDQPFEVVTKVATLNRTHSLKYPKRSVSPNEQRET